MTDEIPWWEQDYADLTVALREQGERRTCVVTLDLPQQRNAMSEAMTASWARLADLLRGDTRLACVVVTGAGSAFCAGGNLSWLVAEPDATVADLRALLDWPADGNDQHKDRRAPLLLLLDIQDQTLGLPVDDVIGFTEDPQTPGDDLLSAETLLGSFQDGHRGQLLHPGLLLGALTRRLNPA